MPTQIEAARQGITTPQMQQIAETERVAAETIRLSVAEGKIVIPYNKSRKPAMVSGIGKDLRTKVNASIGTSTDIIDYEAEVRKALAAQESGADTLMELSVGGDLDRVRREVLAAVDLPVGNVPLYQAFCEAARKFGDPNKLDGDALRPYRATVRRWYLLHGGALRYQPLHHRTAQEAGVPLRRSGKQGRGFHGRLDAGQ
jgi:phosphomethylpyrimidine synthase